MRFRILKIAVVIFFVAMAAQRSGAEVLDKIEVIVNDEIITRSEIDRLLAPVYEQYKTMYQGDDLVVKLIEARQKVIQQLIEDRIILSEAKKLNIEIDEKDVQSKVDETIVKIGSKSNFEEALRQQRLTMKDLKTRYKEQLMAKKLMDHKVGSKIAITPVEVDQYYRNHSKKFMKPEEVKLRSILVKIDNDPKRALARAQEALMKLKAGADFSELAKAYSQGPDASDGGIMGYVKKGDLMPEIEKVIFDLKEGEVSGVIQSSLGYYIFKVEEKKVSRTLSLSDVKSEIEEEIFREKARGKIKGWVEGLKKNAYIAFK